MWHIRIIALLIPCPAFMLKKEKKHVKTWSWDLASSTHRTKTVFPDVTLQTHFPVCQHTLRCDHHIWCKRCLVILQQVRQMHKHCKSFIYFEGTTLRYIHDHKRSWYSQYLNETWAYKSESTHPFLLSPPLARPYRHRLSLLLRTADACPEPRATLINAHGGSCTPAKAWVAFRLPRSISFLFFLPLHTCSSRQSLGHWWGKWPCAAAILHLSFLSKALSIEAELLKRQIFPLLHTPVMLSL